MPIPRSLIAPTADPALEQALQAKLQRRAQTAGSLGELVPLAVRLGLMQHSLKPRFHAPQTVLFAADHGLVVDHIVAAGHPSTWQQVHWLLSSQLPLSVFARIQGLELSVVDCGMADAVSPHPRLLARKIAHGTRNARVAPAMSLEQTHAAIRAGMEIADALPGNAWACAGIGQGSQEAAAMVLAQLSGTDVRRLVRSGPAMDPDFFGHLAAVLQAAQHRHREARDPVEVLAALGGFELAAMVGTLLVAAGKRHLVLVDGMPALAALMVAARIAPAVTDYCVFCRSHVHQGLDQALELFGASALLEMGMHSMDGTGATLAWPMVRSAAALLTEVADGEDPGPTLPAALESIAPDDGCVMVQAALPSMAHEYRGGNSRLEETSG